MRLRRSWTRVLVTSVLAVLAVPLLWQATRPPAAAGSRPAVAAGPSAPSETAAAVVSAELPPVPSPTAAPPVSRAAGSLTGAAGAPMASPAARVEPVRVRTDAAGISAPVVPVGIEAGSAAAMQVPDDASVAGWYTFGPAPGDPEGVAVLTAHVDLASTGPGAFFRLRELQPGDAVAVELADGRLLTYAVTGREQMAKGVFPAGEVFRRDGAHALALITCGGAFDRSSGHYVDNVIVWATPQRS